LARIRRHLDTGKRQRWHIDYLLGTRGVHIENVASFARPECLLNGVTAGGVIVARFGASDCRSGCGSHLKYLGWLATPTSASSAPLASRPSIAGAEDSSANDCHHAHLHLAPAPTDDADALSRMAWDIWFRHYVPEILSLPETRHLWDRAYRPDLIAGDIARGASYWWIQLEARRIGFVAWRRDTHEQWLWLSKLYVLPEFHGLGIGAYALKWVEDAARQQSLQEIRLYVFKKNLRALRAYRRAGFQVIDEEVSDAGNGFVYDDYVMSKTLPRAAFIDDRQHPTLR
jgi:ribosomal protein S18 acetylase RimI-like enzyme